MLTVDSDDNGHTENYFLSGNSDAQQWTHTLTAGDEDYDDDDDADDGLQEDSSSRWQRCSSAVHKHTHTAA